MVDDGFGKFSTRDVEFDGATAEGLRIGSSSDDVRSAYDGFTIATYGQQLQITDSAKTMIVIGLDANDRVESIVIQTTEPG